MPQRKDTVYSTGPIESVYQARLYIIVSRIKRLSIIYDKYNSHHAATQRHRLHLRARNRGIPVVRDNPFCRRTTQYHSHGFRRTKIYQNMCIVSAHVADYLVTIFALKNSMARAVLLVKLQDRPPSICLKNRTNKPFCRQPKKLVLLSVG